MDESSLIDKLILKDSAAFRILLKDYVKPLYNYSKRLLGNQTDAEDIVSETVLSFLSNISQFEKRSSLKTYLFRIATNKICDKQRIDIRERVEEDQKLDFFNRFDNDGKWINPYNKVSYNPEESASVNELIEKINSIVELLPETQRMVFILKDVEGFPNSEICNILKIKETNLRVLLHRARVTIRERIEC